MRITRGLGRGLVIKFDNLRRRHSQKVKAKTEQISRAAKEISFTPIFLGARDNGCGKDPQAAPPDPTDDINVLHQRDVREASDLIVKRA
jgi:hypothetical protein